MNLKLKNIPGDGDLWDRSWWKFHFHVKIVGGQGSRGVQAEDWLKSERRSLVVSSCGGTV